MAYENDSEQNEQLRQENEKRKKMLHIGLAVAGVAGAAIGLHGMSKAAVGITKLQKKSVSKLVASTALAGAGTVVGAAALQTYKRKYSQMNTPDHYN